MASFAYSFPSTAEAVLSKGEVLYDADTLGGLWRITHGVLCLESAGAQSAQVVQLALPGDLIGLEALYELPHAFTARALVGSRVQRLEIADPAIRQAAMGTGFLQQQRQARDMAGLRSGPVAARVQNLLRLLRAPCGLGPQDRGRERLPSLKDLAQLVDSAPETVCRALADAFPAQPRRRRMHQALAFVVPPFAAAA